MKKRDSVTQDAKSRFSVFTKTSFLERQETDGDTDRKEMAWNPEFETLKSGVYVKVEVGVDQESMLKDVVMPSFDSYTSDFFV